jgi:hypothetical protein
MTASRIGAPPVGDLGDELHAAPDVTDLDELDDAPHLAADRHG